MSLRSLCHNCTCNCGNPEGLNMLYLGDNNSSWLKEACVCFDTECMDA